MADAARHLFTACGFQNTRMAQISAAAGIKVGQIYRDFDSKEAIVAEIVAADIAEFLNEETLERAIESRDPVALRHWITNFICDSDPDEGRLLAQIIVEATRNERISSLFQQGDLRISACLRRAVAAIAPHAPAKACDDFVQMIMVLLLGLPQRHLAVPNTDLAAVSASLSALIDRELDRLTQLSAA